MSSHFVCVSGKQEDRFNVFLFYFYVSLEDKKTCSLSSCCVLVSGK